MGTQSPVLYKSPFTGLIFQTHFPMMMNNFPDQAYLIWVVLFTTLYLISFTNAATFNITNQCTYTVWAAASPGGGRRLDRGVSWALNVDGRTAGRIWGRMNCSFDANVPGQCQTGDCGGRLECQGYGKPPNTLVEFALNQAGNQDYFDISLVDGFNIPVEFSSSAPCGRHIKCSAPIVEQCPAELRVPGGCNSPCNVFGTNQYCCTNGPGSCEPTTFSRFFKNKCPDAYSNPQDDQASLNTCPSGTNYRVVFCP
ncbi:OLC1v1036568C1 [Oldenlandia corymbosa var. corymbosa]|uniref:OLC1v1036568C1 n=1 Tax=Oldenlandia corymbosa var. corymbosa TaxID=529605 RepID=A0AAV1CX51_OLDCO|nr:OLC1v1036568C1 [Oldenlandia corymbosa var. corymbosa]